MKSDQVLKYKLLVDGEELEGLVKMGEYKVEKGTAEVPSPDTIRTISNAVRKIPPIEADFKVTRGSRTLTILRAWDKNDETHDCIAIRTDGTGQEIERELWPNTEITHVTIAEYDAANPAFAKAAVTFLPEDVRRIGAAS